MDYGLLVEGGLISILSAALAAAVTHGLHLRADRIRREAATAERVRTDLLLKAGQEAVDAIRKLEARGRSGGLAAFHTEWEGLLHDSPNVETGERSLPEIDDRLSREVSAMFERLERKLAEGELASLDLRMRGIEAAVLRAFSEIDAVLEKHCSALADQRTPDLEMEAPEARESRRPPVLT